MLRFLFVEWWYENIDGKKCWWFEVWSIFLCYIYKLIYFLCCVIKNSAKEGWQQNNLVRKERKKIQGRIIKEHPPVVFVVFVMYLFLWKVETFNSLWLQFFVSVSVYIHATKYLNLRLINELTCKQSNDMLSATRENTQRKK